MIKRSTEIMNMIIVLPITCDNNHKTKTSLRIQIESIFDICLKNYLQYF